MEPKFQSSFIPKGPLSTTAIVSSVGHNRQEKSFFTFVATVIFIISIVAAAGMFGYKYYLKYSIEQMGIDLKKAQATLEPEKIHELTRLDSRINVTKELTSKHRVLTPLFEFLEISTPRLLRFKDFHYGITGRGLELSIKGEARGYATLALFDDILSKNQFFKDSTFSNLNLNDKGDVSFSLEAIIDPNLLSYSRAIEQIGIPTMTSQTATSTPN